MRSATNPRLDEPEGVELGNVISGTGMYVPDNVVTNHDLASIMDTSDDWITSRTGVKERRFASPGVGASDLAIEAARAALSDAAISPGDVDILVTATMTPDYMAPGIAGLVQAGLDIGNVAAFDLRQQCSGFLYGLDLADALMTSGRGETALVVGAEVHAGFQPWSEDTWHKLLAGDGEISEEDYARNTGYRAWSVLFGDGAGAMVLRKDNDTDHGLLATSLHTDGTSFELIWVPGVGSRSRPYVSAEQVASDSHLPEMDGGGLYRRAVRLMPEAARQVADKAGIALDDIDLIVAHQANDRITEGVRKQMGMSPEKVPSNIASYGNTTAGTLPILYHELRKSGRVTAGTVVCFAAFGAGAHYGAALYREPVIG
jgi:3-oxoacyl-[acyl-carrier-protein] synthase III